MDVRLFKHASFTTTAVALTLGSFVVFGYLYFTTFYLQLVCGYTPLQTGLLFISLSAGLVAGAPLSQRATQRFSTRTTIAAGIALMGAAFAGVTGLGAHTSPAWFVMDAFALQLGFALVPASGTTLASPSVPTDRTEAGSALLNTLRQLGSALGVAVLGSPLWSRYAGMMTDRLTDSPADIRRTAAEPLASALGTGDPAATQAAAPAFLSAMHTTTLIAAAVCGIALLVTLFIRPSRRTGITLPQAAARERERAGHSA
ncbi:MFS transporter [Streptomyces sp. NPDC045369]|uniref:MFS transporter n=1 Tax=Streptomyces sp. NPDC045369 TaxID=3155732 RepID=UPI0033F0F9DE